MTNCKTHDSHDHKHQEGCGHQQVQHDDHMDYMHDGHLHHVHDDHIDEHQLSGAGSCTPDHACGSHDAGHAHGESCGHDAVPHGDHTDYVVNGHLHHPCGQHCDDHGAVKTK